MVLHARVHITMHRLSLGMRVKELRTKFIGMIPIVGAPTAPTIVTFIRHIILLLAELQGTQSLNLKTFPTIWGFGIVKVQVSLWS